jgi:hypothetical protein
MTTDTYSVSMMVNMIGCNPFKQQALHGPALHTPSEAHRLYNVFLSCEGDNLHRRSHLA